MDIQHLVADYRASDKASFLAYLDGLSEQKQDGGLFHGAHIHFIQQTLADKEDGLDGFVLKAAIAGILELVPSVIPLDLPERVKDGREFTDEEAKSLEKAVNALNRQLLLPIGAYEILAILKAGRAYAGMEYIV